MIKLRINDDDLANEVGRIVYIDDADGMSELRRAIESAGIEAPAVTVEELASVIGECRRLDQVDSDIARAVLELMQRRTVPAAPGSQWVDLARVTNDELGQVRGTALMDCQRGRSVRAWLIEKAGVKA